MTKYPDLITAPHGLEKLKHLSMPPLGGKSFLDVRCGDGLYCGFASFDGASRVIGLEPDVAAVARARRAFPDCEFRPASWDVLPEGPFDVILLTSALHLADDPNAFVRSLVDRLTEHGTVIVELAVSRKKLEGKPYGLRLPTMGELAALFAGVAWKHMGASLATVDEDVRFHVVHLRRRRPFAYLLLQPPAYGKSTIARELFAPAGMRVVSGDRTIHLVAKGDMVAPEELTRVIQEDYSNTTIDRTIHRIVERGLIGKFVHFLFDQAGSQDFALDAFLPISVHETVSRLALDAGYVPVRLEWENPHPSSSGQRTVTSRVEAYEAALHAASGIPEPALKPVGYVDRIAPRKTTSIIRGWAIDEQGQLPGYFEASVAGRSFVPAEVRKLSRTDVSEKFGLPHDLVGFEFRVPTIDDLETTTVRCGRSPDSLGPVLRVSRKALR